MLQQWGEKVKIIHFFCDPEKAQSVCVCVCFGFNLDRTERDLAGICPDKFIV